MLSYEAEEVSYKALFSSQDYIAEGLSIARKYRLRDSYTRTPYITYQI
jgi:hypothetical protein